jgi:polyphosphate glucokinase
MKALGIDVGGSGIKGAIVDTRTGRLVSERFRVPTPEPSTPRAVGAAMARLIQHFEWKGPVGCGLPGPVKRGRLVTMSNLHKAWVGLSVADALSKACGHRVTVLNDADAAGLAEMRFGAGRKESGVVLMLTVGTGIGSALFVDGVLVPNTELGQLDIRGKRAEKRASAKVKKDKSLSWGAWAKRFDEYLSAVETILLPDLLIIGGGVSRRSKKFASRLKTRARLVPAQLQNEAGIVGAALAAARSERR